MQCACHLDCVSPIRVPATRVRLTRLFVRCQEDEGKDGTGGLYAHAGIVGSATAILKDLEEKGLLKVGAVRSWMAHMLRCWPHAGSPAHARMQRPGRFTCLGVRPAWLPPPTPRWSIIAVQRRPPPPSAALQDLLYAHLAGVGSGTPTPPGRATPATSPRRHRTSLAAKLGWWYKEQRAAGNIPSVPEEVVHRSASSSGDEFDMERAGEGQHALPGDPLVQPAAPFGIL